MVNDFELLGAFVKKDSEESFRTLVERHSGMVNAVALRCVRDQALAQEITQAVFILLARKAPALSEGTVIAGWLYRTTRFVVKEALRTEQRRRQNYQEFAQMNDSSSTSNHEADSVWNQISPIIEDALGNLRDADRDAIILRFFEGRSFAEVAQATGTSEAAAKMRVGRALEKLRNIFTRKGISISSGALLLALSSPAANAAPAGLAASIATAALNSQLTNETSLALLVKGALKLMVWNKIKTGLIGAAVLLLLGGTAIWLHNPILRHFHHGFLQQPSVASFSPMAGQWEGTFETRGDGIQQPITQNVALDIRTEDAGRECEIEMRVVDSSGNMLGRYHFTHSLNQPGNRVTTMDDPQIRKLAGEGTITESRINPNDGVWRIGFRTPHINQRDYSDCQWDAKGNDLTITRVDHVFSPQGKASLSSVLKVHRKASQRADL